MTKRSGPLWDREGTCTAERSPTQTKGEREEEKLREIAKDKGGLQVCRYSVHVQRGNFIISYFTHIHV